MAPSKTIKLTHFTRFNFQQKALSDRRSHNTRRQRRQRVTVAPIRARLSASFLPPAIACWIFHTSSKSLSFPALELGRYKDIAASRLQRNADEFNPALYELECHN